MEDWKINLLFEALDLKLACISASLKQDLEKLRKEVKKKQKAL